MVKKVLGKLIRHIFGLTVIASCVVGGCYIFQSIRALSTDTVVSDQANPSYEDPNLNKNALVNSIKYVGHNTVEGIKDGAGIIADDAVTIGSGMAEDTKDAYGNVSDAISDKVDGVSLNAADYLEQHVDALH